MKYHTAREIKRNTWNWLQILIEPFIDKEKLEVNKEKIEDCIKKLEFFAVRNSSTLQASGNITESMKLYLEEQVKQKKAIVAYLQKNLNKQQNIIETLCTKINQ